MSIPNDTLLELVITGEEELSGRSECVSAGDLRRYVFAVETLRARCLTPHYNRRTHEWSLKPLWGSFEAPGL